MARADVCAECGRMFLVVGRPMLVPLCPDHRPDVPRLYARKSPVVVQTAPPPPAPRPLPAPVASQYESVWNGREGLSGYRGSSSLKGLS